MRTWHAGMQNHTDHHRGMLVNIHTHRKFLPTSFQIEKGNEDFFEHPILTSNVEFVDAPIQYLPTKNGAKKGAPSALGIGDVEKLVPSKGGMTFDEIRSELPGTQKTSKLRDLIKEHSRQGRIRREGSGLASRWRRYVRP